VAARSKIVKGKRTYNEATGTHNVGSKNANGSGSTFPLWRKAIDPKTGEVVKVADGWLSRRLVGAKWVQARGTTKVAAEARLAEKVTKAEIDAHLSPSFKLEATIGELADRWISDVAAFKVRASTLETYRKSINRFGDLASLRVIDLRRGNVEAWQLALLRRLDPATGLPFPGAARTTNATRRVLGQVMKYAIRHGYRTDDPTDDDDLVITVPEKDGNHITAAEISRLISATDPHPYGLIVRLLFNEGWRVSECLGLCWSDIDFVAGTAQVQRAVVDADKGVAFGPPKTKNTRRTAVLLPNTVERLRRRKVEQAAERLAAPSWPVHVDHEGVTVEPCSTTYATARRGAGELIRRQNIDAYLRKVAPTVGLDPAKLGAHVGRRSVNTISRNDGRVSIDDVAADRGQTPKTAAGYVVGVGDRVKDAARVRGELLDTPVNY
jgi:integrase